MTLGLHYGARSDVGLLREGNEDSMYAGPRLLAVADGMGGHAAGEVASRVVIETVAALDTDPPAGDATEALREAVETANGYLRDMVAADGALEGMGTTLTALLWVEDRLALAHVGDSRGYLYRDGRLELVTHDHTLVQNLVDEGRIQPEEANTHPQRSWITRALDGRPTVELDLSMREARIGDRYLICSDGLSSYVGEDTIAEALAEADPQQACERLVELALRAGGPDNITCIVADVVDRPDRDEEPIVGGAAAEDGVTGVPASALDTPSTRAAAIAPPTAGGGRSHPVARHSRRSEADTDDEPAPPAAGGSRRTVIVLASILLLVVLGAVATFFYIRTQFYVGAAGTPDPTVAVYRGVSGSVLGVDLSHLDQRTNLPLRALPDFQREQVQGGINASSRTDAERIVASLRDAACPTAAATPTPSHRPGAHSSPSPSPSPPPAYCKGSP